MDGLFEGVRILKLCLESLPGSHSEPFSQFLDRPRFVHESGKEQAGLAFNFRTELGLLLSACLQFITNIEVFKGFIMSNIHLRKLDQKERDISTRISDMPLVLEYKGAGKGDLKELTDYLSANSDELANKLDTNGALLLRNFNITSEVEFEKAVTSLRSINCIEDYFLTESGRSLIEGTKYVFYTNKFYKTGAGLTFGVFHNENYRSPDVPNFISFCCLETCKQGGETGMVDMAGVYEALDDDLKAKLESKTLFCKSFPLSFMAKKYDVPLSQMERLCEQEGYTVMSDENDQNKTMHLYKPSILEHPRTKKPAVIMNLGEIITKGIHDFFKDDYRGPKWWLHRLAWKYKLVYFLDDVSRLTRFSEIYRDVMNERAMKKKDKPKKNGHKPKAPSGLGQDPTVDKVENVLTKEEGRQIQKAVRENFVSFKWQVGDLLIVDNLRMAHAGMPGKGSRTIRVILSNPVQFELSRTSPGRQRIKPNPAHQTVVQRLYQL